MSVSVDAGDSIYVFDGAGRVVVFGPDGRSVRDIAWGQLPFTDPRITSDGRILVGGDVTTAESAGYGLHVARGDGSVERSMALLPNPNPREPQPEFRIAPDLRDSTFWTAYHTPYQIHLWSISGRLIRSHTLKRPWFEMHFGEATVKGPVSSVNAIMDDGGGRIWTATRVKSANWAAFLPGRGGGEVSVRGVEWDKLYDTMIEVLDSESGTSLGGVRIDEFIFGALGGQLFAAFATNEQGSPVVRILRVAID